MKGNMFLGYARGAVGDVVFSRQNGQQQGRARNRRPNNPKTPRQMMQRSLFANSVKFHSKGLQKLFKFAFEDKKANETDYNAFMRHNLGEGVRISKQASQNPLYPALGKWQMSCGSLMEAQVSKTAQSGYYDFAIPGLTSSVTTWGQVCVQLKSAYNLQEGDIVSIVHITAIGATTTNMPAVIPPTGLQGSDWRIEQRLIDTSSYEDLPDVWTPASNKLTLHLGDTAIDTYAQGVCIIFSRRVSNGLKVSSSFLIGNSVTDSIIEASSEQTYVDAVLADWMTSDEAILEGALLPN